MLGLVLCSRFAIANSVYTLEIILSTIEDEVAAQIGVAVKSRREQLGLSLRALALKSRVSASMISDIERGAKSPTISTLAMLARTLEVPISTLVDKAVPAAGRIRVVRASERSDAIDPTNGARRRSFGAGPAESKVEFMRYTVPARTLAGPFPPHPGGTIEHMHIAAGSVRVIFGTDAVSLNAGDSCACIADVSHHFDNREGEVEALLYIVVEEP